jgi:hypothetical protein
VNTLEQFHIYSETRNDKEITDKNGISINIKFDAIISTVVYQFCQSEPRCNYAMLNPVSQSQYNHHQKTTGATEKRS